ncbi:hypothetical protein ACQP00_11810 [Dactylosporangium sp. CS-047395]|uniref:hypothetical protein n=1 Tax=Dactylosporangium sp. CS-047395 TaxID=3239936 RepID=UPI003D8D20AA
MNRHDIRALLEEADPARGVPVGRGDAEAVLRRAARDITNYDAPPRRASRRAVVAVAAAVGVAGVFAVAVAWPRPGEQPVPVPGVSVLRSADTGDCLLDLADRAEAASYDGAAGRYEFLHLSTLSGDTTQLSGGSFAQATWPEDVRVWLAADGSGHRTSKRGEVSYANAASREYYTQHPDMLGGDDQDADFAAGQWSVTPLPPLDPAGIAAELYQPRENGPSAAIVSVAELNQNRVLDRAHRVAVLRFLAGVEGVTCDGTVETGAGTGLLVSAPIGRGPHPTPGDQGRESLVLDPRTGDVIAAGNGPGHWNTLWLERGRVDR